MGSREEGRGGRRYRRTEWRREDEEGATGCYISAWKEKLSHGPLPLSIFTICDLGSWVFQRHGDVILVDERGRGRTGWQGSEHRSKGLVHRGNRCPAQARAENSPIEFDSTQ
ncbi:hypothetical protein D1007_15247 [Hordeum vulgare]|nr:hypothetical protein D1007_15247 [Hordeum vulgare]